MNGRLGSPARQVTTCRWRRTPTSPGPDLAQLPQPQHYQHHISPQKGKATIRRYLEGGQVNSGLPIFPDSILIVTLAFITLWLQAYFDTKTPKVLQTGRGCLPIPTLVPGSVLDKEDWLHPQAVAA